MALCLLPLSRPAFAQELVTRNMARLTLEDSTYVNVLLGVHGENGDFQEKDIYMPRLPSLIRARETRDRPVEIRSLDDFPDTDAEHYGLSGSATSVEKIFPPEHDVKREMLTGENLPGRVMDVLRDWKVLGGV